MKHLTLTMLDTSGIQDYIFKSNRLQENIGASEIVYRATTLWAFEALDGFKHNIEFVDHAWGFRREFQFEKDGLDAEVIYAGGGNTFILFRERSSALQTTGRLTRRILKEAPNLTVIAQHVGFDWEKDSLREKRDELLRKLAAHKQARHPSVPLLGLGVSATCQSTGLPAVRTNVGLKLDENEEETRLISREVEWKLKHRNKGSDRLKKALGREAGSYRFPSDIDKLGRLKGEESYVAVVHADGNRMGDHLNETFQNAQGNRHGIEKLREFSEKINDASLQALLRVVKLARQAADRDLVPVTEDYLPIRPLVFGGDDVTFLCNGQLGISLASAYLQYFEEETAKAGFQDLHACAGVSIVKMHYPFARAYTLSEQLLSNAKRMVRTEAGGDCSALDWHFATGGLSGSIGVIREREYQNGDLLMRPLLLWSNDRVQGRYWIGGVEEILRKFREETPWQESHSKVVGLRDPLREGPEHVKAYLRDYELSLPYSGNEEAQSTGWAHGRCVYFDAIELLDHHIALEEEEEVPV